MDENPTCPVCGGPGVPLGILGRLEHFRCRNCGADFNRRVDPDPGDRGGQQADTPNIVDED